jgi:hypothetical protein
VHPQRPGSTNQPTNHSLSHANTLMPSHIVCAPMTSRVNQPTNQPTNQSRKCPRPILYVHDNKKQQSKQRKSPTTAKDTSTSTQIGHMLVWPILQPVKQALHQLESMLAEVAAPLLGWCLALTGERAGAATRGTHQRHCVSLQVPKNVGWDLPHL